MEKKKIKLEELKVDSFITSAENSEEVKGGTTPSTPGCASALVTLSFALSFSYISYTITSDYV